MEHLHAETGATGVSGQHNHLNGTLTFLNCEAVTVEGVGLRCGAGAERRPRASPSAMNAGNHPRAEALNVRVLPHPPVYPRPRWCNTSIGLRTA